MEQGEFEKHKESQVKAIRAMSNIRFMKVIDLIDLLLEQDPSRIVAVPGELFRGGSHNTQEGLPRSPDQKDKSKWV